MISPHTGLRLVAAAGLGLLLLAIFLITGGRFDPHPVGPLAADIPLTSLTAAPETTTLRWLDAPLPDQPATAQLTAAFSQGAVHSGYGLAAGTAQAYLATAVSPTGMVSIWEHVAGEPDGPHIILPWQVWPHVRDGAAANELWLTLEENTAEVRINREPLWSGPVTVGPENSRYGLIAMSFTREPAVVDFERLRLFVAVDE